MWRREVLGVCRTFFNLYIYSNNLKTSMAQCSVGPCLAHYDPNMYSDILRISKRFVDTTIAEAVQVVADRNQDVIECAPEPLISSDKDWPNCGSINVQNAQENIEKLMNEWKSVPGLMDWMYNVDFIALKADQFSDFYLFEVKWSIPTPEYPVPQVTASVFFSIEASRVREKTYPVDVSYVFEGTRFVHRPEIPFQQKWLYDILDVKTFMFKSFHF